MLEDDPIIPDETRNGVHFPAMRRSEREKLETEIAAAAASMKREQMIMRAAAVRLQQDAINVAAEKHRINREQTHWIARHPVLTFFGVALVIGIILQIVEGPASKEEVFRNCMKAAQAGWGDALYCE